MPTVEPAVTVAICVAVPEESPPALQTMSLPRTSVTGLLWFVFLRTLTYSPVLRPPTTRLVKRSEF